MPEIIHDIKIMYKIAKKSNIIYLHKPMPFKSLKKILMSLQCHDDCEICIVRVSDK